jgi:lipopolysaccharide transport system ATP-binding protein
MDEIVISCENISKQYRLGVIGSRTIAQDLNRWWAKVRGREDPFLKIGDVNRLNKIEGDFIWALKDISLEIKQGEVLGVIGKNGAGKSTLLKLFSRVTVPTTGIIKIKGKIASLLEIGTGFHPELTGRENVYLNGAILGMTKNEIKRKFDEIIEFSGIGKYIDTPVKRYSSGMYVRLAFAVAAHLEPDILIVDEVLAVGDFEFQKRCLGKMKDVSKQGRTVLFVSHNMGAINSLCTHAVLLSQGTVKASGNPGNITGMYLKGQAEVDNEFSLDLRNAETLTNDSVAKILNVRLFNKDSVNFDIIRVSDEINIEMEYEIHENGFKPVPQVTLVSMKGETVFVSTCYKHTDFSKGKYKARIVIPSDFLNSETYYFQFCIETMDPFKDHYRFIGMPFTVIDDIDSITKAGYRGEIPGIIRPLLVWSNEKTSI